MNKDEYTNLLDQQPWKEMENLFSNIPEVAVDPFCKIHIKTEDWINFTKDNFDLAQQQWEHNRPHYTEQGNRLVDINNMLGRNKQNTFELNYGMNGDTNEKLKDLLGKDNISLLKADPDSLLVRLIVKFPGNGVAWHRDDASSYKKKFPDYDNYDNLKRLWFSVDDWRDGHAIQISKSVLSKYEKGAVYNIPFGVGHASSCFGYYPMYTVSLTGLFDD